MYLTCTIKKDLVEDAEDKVWPAGQQSFSALSEHEITDTSKVLNVIAVVGLVDKGHDVTLLSLLETWQLAYAKVCMIDLEETEAVKAAANKFVLAFAEAWRLGSVLAGFAGVIQEDERVPFTSSTPLTQVPLLQHDHADEGTQ